MAYSAAQAQIPAAFRQLALTMESDILHIRSLEDVVTTFQLLRWDEKIFILTDLSGARWTVEVCKSEPALTITASDPAVTAHLHVSGDAFWNGLAEAMEKQHPGLQLGRRESFFQRLFHDVVNGHHPENVALETPKARLARMAKQQSMAKLPNIVWQSRKEAGRAQDMAARMEQHSVYFE